MTAKKTATPPAIPFGGLVKLQQDGWDGVPDGPNPFYLGARDGLFIHKRMLIGRGLARVERWPEAFPAVGSSTGMFDFDAPPIPAKMMGQVVNFFERIYDRQHTEAAVLLTMHAETKEWRVFVPTQLVSHGGVNYVFEPTHIRWPWVLVGSIHSHCDFGAGHSGTDTNDADGFDGFHATTGYIKRDVPQIVAMVAMNKRLFHYKPDQFEFLFDFSEPKQHEAPAWWDRYVENTVTKEKPVGFELYAKYDRPTVVKSEGSKVKQPGKPSPGYQPTGYNSTDWVWNDAAKRMVHKSWKVDDAGNVTYPDQMMGKGQHGLTVITTQGGAKITRVGDDPRKDAPIVHQRGSEDFIPGIGYGRAPRREYAADDWDEFYRLLGVEEAPSDFANVSPADLIEAGYSWDPDDRTWHWTGNTSPRTLEDLASGILNESREFNARQEAERGVNWEQWTDGRVVRPATQTELERLGIVKDEAFWEDTLPKELVTQLVGSNLVTEDDLDYVNDFPQHGGTTEFWQHLMMRKALSACETLQMLGVEAKVHVRMSRKPPADIDAELLPEDKPSAVILLPDGKSIPIKQADVQPGVN